MARSSPTDLTLDPLLLVALGLLAAHIGIRVRSARHRGEAMGPWRWSAVGAGVGVVAMAFISPLATVAGSYLLSAHLVQITLLMGFAPPLLLLGTPRHSPARRRPVMLRGVGRMLVHPAVAIVTVNGVLLGWHVPAIYAACLAHSELFSAQLVTLLAASIAFWWPIIIQPPGREKLISPLVQLGYILLATVPQTFVGLLVALARSPLYPGYATAPRVLGFSPLADQQVAGACMAILSKLALFAAFSVVMWRVLDGGGVEDDCADDNGGNGGFGGWHRDGAPGPVTPSAPAWVIYLDRAPATEEPAPVARERQPATAGR